MPAINHAITALETEYRHILLQRELAIILKNDPVAYIKKRHIMLGKFIKYLQDHIAHYGTPVCSLGQLDKLGAAFSASENPKNLFDLLSSLKNNTVNTLSLECPTDIQNIDVRLAHITNGLNPIINL